VPWDLSASQLVADCRQRELCMRLGDEVDQAAW
jgi:hypothetical protein